MLSIIIKRIIGTIGKTALRILIAVIVLLTIVVPMAVLILVNNVPTDTNTAALTSTSVIIPIIAVGAIIFVCIIAKDAVKDLINPDKKERK